MIMPAPQDKPRNGGRYTEIVSEDEAIEVMDRHEHLLKKGFTKGDLSFLVGYKTRSGLGFCIDKARIPAYVRNEVNRIFDAVAADGRAVRALKQEARALARQARERRNSPNGRVAEDTKSEFSTAEREAGDRLDRITQEPPHRMRSEMSAPPARNPAGTAPHRDTIWSAFERARNGVGSASRIMQDARERWGNPLTHDGLTNFVRRLQELDRDMGKVIDACR